MRRSGRALQRRGRPMCSMGITGEGMYTGAYSIIVWVVRGHSFSLIGNLSTFGPFFFE